MSRSTDKKEKTFMITAKENLEKAQTAYDDAIEDLNAKLWREMILADFRRVSGLAEVVDNKTVNIEKSKIVGVMIRHENRIQLVIDYYGNVWIRALGRIPSDLVKEKIELLLGYIDEMELEKNGEIHIPFFHENDKFLKTT
jgi:hypothetical protein